MSDCDEGYNCDRCGEYVENIRESELYLRFVLGAVPLDELPREPERHIRCAPEFAQFIVDDAFEPVACEDSQLAKSNLPDEVRKRLRLRHYSYRGVQQIPLDQIVGSVNRYNDFTNTFLPRSAASLSLPSTRYGLGTGSITKLAF